MSYETQDLLALMPNLRAFAVSLCGDIDRAEDLAQATFLKAWAHEESFTEGTNLRAWLFTILRNTYFSECRRRRREVEDVDGKRAAELTVAPRQFDTIVAQDLSRAWDLVSFEQQEALMNVGYAGFSYEEAADMMGCAVGTIKSRVNRAREKLIALLGEDIGKESPQKQRKNKNGHRVSVPIEADWEQQAIEDSFSGGTE